MTIDIAAERAWLDGYRDELHTPQVIEQAKGYLDEIDRLKKSNRDTVERLVGEYGREIDRLNAEVERLRDRRDDRVNMIVVTGFDDGTVAT